jgi:hypothetical protein
MELVLVIPSVLAMLGDNPMQSEFACHIGFRGKFFCRVCWVKGVPDEDEDEDQGEADDTSASDASSAASGTESVTRAEKPKKGKKKQKKNESVADMISRITQFMTVRFGVPNDLESWTNV